MICDKLMLCVNGQFAGEKIQECANGNFSKCIESSDRRSREDCCYLVCAGFKGKPRLCQFDAHVS